MARVHLSRIVAVTLLGLMLGLGRVPGAVAQEGQALVAITRVDSQAFPQVTLSVLVSDENGPRDGLAAADFRISEDNIQVPAEAIRVTGDAAQALRLVLALDLSMNPDFLRELKEASLSLIDGLGPADEAALLTFNEEVKTVQDFTQDKQVLRTALAAQKRQGDYTALHEAAFEAVGKLSDGQAGRKAVILLTNSRNNVGARSLDEVVNAARASGVPVYVVGFYLVERPPLETLTAQTGGRAFILGDILADPAEPQASLETIGQLLRQGGYQVTFESGLKADNLPHRVTVGVAYEGRAGQAGGDFQALPRPLTVELLGVTDGQTVRGSVELGVAVTPSTSIESVSYSLNGQQLQAMTQQPYGYKWDIPQEISGSYRLTARVTDRAGNQGEAGVNLKVDPPVVVTVSARETEVKVGQPISIGVQIDTLADIASVEWLVDDERVGGQDGSLARVSLDTGTCAPCTPGEHRISVRARDALGREGTGELRLNFLAAPPPAPGLIERRWLGIGPRGLAIGGTVASALAILAVSLIGLVAVVGAQKRRPRGIYRLEIANLGNVENQYALRAEDPWGALSFQFVLRGVELPERVPAGADQVASEEMPGEVPAAQARPAPGGVRTAAGSAMRAGGAVAGGLSAAGRVLPGSAGAMLGRAARPLYRAQSSVSRTSAQAQRTAGQMSRLGAPGGGARAVPSPAAQLRGAATRAQMPPAAPVSAGHSQSWFETPWVAPGETLPVNLRITPRDPYQTQRYDFQVWSRAIEPAGSPWLAETGQVQIKGISGFARLLPYLLFGLVTLIVATGATLFLLTLRV
jgi:VWFA-related protein